MSARLLPIGGLAVCMTSCTVMTGNGTGYTYASFAGNAEGMTITPTGASAAKIDNSTGAQLGKDIADKVASAWVWGKAFDAAGQLIDRGFDYAEGSTAADVDINAQNNATKETIQTFVPPEPAVTPP